MSRYQGEVDWFSVAGSSVKFAFAKATEGTGYVDSSFSKNWAGIQEAGLYRGAYHYGHPGGDPESQAAHFAAVVGEVGYRDLPPVLDLEQSDGHSATHVLEWARLFVGKAESLFKRSIIVYTGYFWRGPMGDPNDPFFRQRALWLAAYNDNPIVPSSWTHWTFWQYSEGQHNNPVSIPGVRPCDQDRFAGTEADLEALCVAGTSLPPLSHPQPNQWPGTHFIWPRTPAITGPEVRRWQERVTQRGFSIACDGVYGPQSKAACIAIQRELGLVADGIVGRLTWNATFAGDKR
ncbi:MAG: GH25 family lysozyme [Polyangiaceae bacterium]